MTYCDWASRRRGMLAAALTGFLTIGGCVGSDVPYGLPSSGSGATSIQQPAAPAPRPPASGEVIGSGATRLALLLPLSGEGNAAQIAGELKNAAILAMGDTGSETLELVVKDTAGTTEGASAAAAQAVAEGAAAVLGPLFSANVRAAAPSLAAAGIPMIAFSSDRGAASPGVYLNAFLPQGVVERTLRYAAGQGVRGVVAILPEGPAGDIAEAEARRTLLSTGGDLVAVARYAYDNASVYEAVRGVAEAIRGADAVFIPDGGTSPATIASTITEAGVDLSRKKLLGTGQWTTANLADPGLQGAWFADTDQGRLAGYRQRYQARFGAQPSLTSALAYDTVILAANIARGTGGMPRNAIENPVGFSGYTGIFRFSAHGTTERGYAVYEVRGGAAEIVDPAPTRFAGGS